MDWVGKDALALFVANAQQIKKDFFWHNTMTKRLAAFLYASEGKAVDCDAIRACHERIKQRTGPFSMFRGNLAIAIASLLSLSEDPEGTLDQSLLAYDMLKAEGFRASDYLTMAAYMVASFCKPEKFRDVAARSKAFYDGMRKQHWLITGQDDYIHSVMLGLSDIDVRWGVEELERLYVTLKPLFPNGSSLQGLTQVLLLGGETSDCIDRLARLRDGFRQRRLRLDRSTTLPSLGILALLPAPVEDIIEAVALSHDELRQQRGFGVGSITKQEILLLAASLVSTGYMQNLRNDLVRGTLTTSVTNLLIAQQVAIIVVITSATTAASTSSH